MRGSTAQPEQKRKTIPELVKRITVIPVSIVIITRNEEQNIAACIWSARLVSSDIVVVDCGSTDKTTQVAATLGARVIETNWESYGSSRNMGAAAAKFDWVLALDADERIPGETALFLRTVCLKNGAIAYRFKRINYF